MGKTGKSPVYSWENRLELSKWLFSIANCNKLPGGSTIFLSLFCGLYQLYPLKFSEKQVLYMVSTSNESVPEVAIDEINRQKRGSPMTMETFIWKKNTYYIVMEQNTYYIVIHSYSTSYVFCFFFCVQMQSSTCN